MTPQRHDGAHIVEGVDVWNWNDLLSDSRRVVNQLQTEHRASIGQLVREVIDYRRWLLRRAGPMTDITLAERLAHANIELLGHVVHSGDHDQRLAQIASRYFVDPADGEDDLHSPFGFDDDVEVFNAVVRRLGLQSRQISLV